MGDLLQVEKLTSAQPRATFYKDGAPTDLDASAVPTVTLTRPDGTNGPASGAVSSVGTGTYTFTLAGQTDPTIFTIAWQGTLGGQSQTIITYVEVVGQHLYPLAALRAVKVGNAFPFQSTTDYPNQTLLDRRTEVTNDFQRRCGWSFISRFARDIVSGTGGCEVVLDHRSNGAQKLLSVTVNGIAQPLSGFTLDRSGVLYATSNFTPTGYVRWGVNNVAVEYVHGWTRPPATIVSAALARTAMLLLPSQAGSTVSTWITPDGTTYQYDQAGGQFAGGGTRHYGVPAIDSVLNQYSALGTFA